MDDYGNKIYSPKHSEDQGAIFHTQWAHKWAVGPNMPANYYICGDYSDFCRAWADRH